MSDHTPHPVGGEAAPALAALHALAFAGSGERSWSATELATLLAGPGIRGLALGRPPCGFALWRAAGEEAELLTIAVAPAARRQGIGASLLDAALASAIASGARRVVLEVAADNRAALALYLRRGFAPVGRRSGYYARPDGPADALILACLLP